MLYSYSITDRAVCARGRYIIYVARKSYIRVIDYAPARSGIPLTGYIIPILYAHI